MRRFRPCKTCGEIFDTENRRWQTCSLECRLAAEFIVLENGCWEWTGATAMGYGILEWRGLRIEAHQLSYMLAHGLTDRPSGLICHDCDYRKCINPDHLYEGTHATNSQDMVHRARSGFGVKNSQAKLSDNDVIEIRRAFRENHTVQTVLASQFGVTKAMIGRIISRKTWKHLPD